MKDDIKMGLAAGALALLIIANVFTSRLTASADVPQVTPTPTTSAQAPDCLSCHQPHEIPK